MKKIAFQNLLVGVWFPFKKRVVSKSLGALGVIGIVVSEIYKFLTWHTLTVTGEVSLQMCIRDRSVLVYHCFCK